MKMNRRDVLKMGAAGTTLPWLMNLPQMAHAATGEDYKALVCVFLAGGNDHNNTVIPYDATNYAAYKKIRSEIALKQGSILPLLNQSPLPFGQKLGLNGSMTGLHKLFNSGKMAVLLNVGPLYRPMTKAEFKTQKQDLPPKLFSHNDQQSIWQSSHAEGAKKGWGGVMADQKISQNNNQLFSCISVKGNNVFLAGNTATQFHLNANGVKRIHGTNPEKDWIFGSKEVSKTLTQLITQSSNHIMEQTHADVTKRAINAEATLSAALAKQTALTTSFDQTNDLAKQLNMVAKIIQARKALGIKRQVFFVRIGGFDTHDDLLSRHGGLLKKVSDAMTSFYDATVEMGISENVTSFTASDFGRTFISNGDGSDHGWGSHHFIVGGSVQGQNFYGTAPEIKLESKDDIGKGRLLPSTSVDQYAATLASWFGVPDAKLETVSPNLKNFPVKTLGFI